MMKKVESVPLSEVVHMNPPLPAKPGWDEVVSVVPMKSVEARTNKIDYSQQAPAVEVKSGLRPFIEGDVLLAKITPSMENGKAAVIRGMPTRVGFGSTEFHVLRSRGDVLAEYIYYFLGQKTFLSSARQNMTGTAGQLRVPTAWLGNVLLPVPPVDLQQDIINEIERHFTRLDAATEALRRVSHNVKRHGRSALAKAFSNRGWDEEPLGSLTINYDSRRVPLKRMDRDKRHGPFPYYGASGVIDSIDAYLFDGRYLLIAEDGANLLSRNSPIAFHAEGRFWVNNHAHVVQTRENLSSDFLALFLNDLDISRNVTGTAQPKLTQTALNRILVPVPPKKAQEQTVAEMERNLSISASLADQVLHDLLRSETLRQSVLTKAFSGDLVSIEAV